MLNDLQERRRLATVLRELKQSHAKKITEDLLQANPAWVERYGEAARTRGVEDSACHIDFLASAIEAGSPEAFNEYARWTTRMLAARGIEPKLLAESLCAIVESLASELDHGAERVVRELIEAGVAQCTADVVSHADPREKLSDLQRTYLQASLAGERRAARQIALDAIDAGLSLEEFYTEIVQECMYTVGELWETNRISVADEHTATAITQSVMAEVYQRIPWSDATKGNVVLTGVEGELHQIGAHLVADALDLSGWNVRFLGSNLPHGDVLATVDEHEAGILGISVTVLFNAGRVFDLVEQVRDRFGEHVRIVIGGAAFRHRPTICAEIGADRCVFDLRDTLQEFDGFASNVEPA